MISQLRTLFRRPAADEAPEADRLRPYTLTFQWAYEMYAHLNPVTVHVYAEDELNALCDGYRLIAINSLDRLAAHGHDVSDEDKAFSAAIDVFNHIVTFAGHHEPVDLLG